MAYRSSCRSYPRRSVRKPRRRRFPRQAIGESAAKHGRELRERGYNISQVVHDYGDICQAITEVALEQNVPIRTEEFHMLNRCLDTAIAEAVTEHARITAESRSREEVERSGNWLMKFVTSSTPRSSRSIR